MLAEAVEHAMPDQTGCFVLLVPAAINKNNMNMNIPVLSFHRLGFYYFATASTCLSRRWCNYITAEAGAVSSPNSGDQMFMFLWVTSS